LKGDANIGILISLLQTFLRFLL